MKATDIKSCYLGPAISPEQFISEHFFLYLINGQIEGYDGNKHYTLTPGESCIVRKNHLVRYNKHKSNEEFGKVVVIFDEPFLKQFIQKHKAPASNFASENAFLAVNKSSLIINFIQSLEPYYTGSGKIDPGFTDIKREELLLILLQIHPEYSAVLFDFGKPGKIDLEALINKNYKFNVSLNQLARLSGRSLSAFKRDFEEIFKNSPSRWLTEKRLKEAYFLIEKKNKKPGDIYFELGFKDLSHFSYAFKKQFGKTPSEVSIKK